ncbi:uncharacterized protein LOC116180276 [Photinus pyralis]|uniref:uncharacterized protein LOC116180269 n=1 Tax=Photinus pyralis TaxID=7054 RepID=UPI0012676553|nr:uncharacterized protein LOC116180269 [Photinus pyralis]XP_031356043.1 uncharacterized protein LOC116180276 [Photinus pyralis]
MVTKFGILPYQVPVTELTETASVLIRIMKNLAYCLFLFAFLLARGSGEDAPCGSCPNLLTMRGSAKIVSSFRELCLKPNGLEELKECLCGDIDLTCIGDVFNKCQLLDGPILPGSLIRFNFNCLNATELHHLRYCICIMSAESCQSHFLKCAQEGVPILFL